jgi:hypothetical protein
MKTYVLSETAMRRIETAIETIEHMINSDEEFPLEAVNSQFDKIEAIMATDFSNEVQDKVEDAIQDALKTPFPNFNIKKYKIDMRTDKVYRSNGELVTSGDATTTEQTLLKVYKGMVEDANQVDAEINDTLEQLRAQVYGI